MCRALGIRCLCIQSSEEEAIALVDALGLRETDGWEEEGTEQENTEDLLRDLSEAEKLGTSDGKDKIASATKTRKYLGSVGRSTRSKGGSLQWSKSMNPDQPIS